MTALPPRPTKWTDQEWIAKLTAHHDDAWTRLRDTIYRGLSIYVREHAREPDQAAFVVGLVEDATQEALLAVRAKLETFRGESRFTTWVYCVAVNVLLGQLRRRPISIPSPVSVTSCWPSFGTPPDPRVVAADNAEVVVLWRQRGVSPAGERFDGQFLGQYQLNHGKLARAPMFDRSIRSR
jgi:DNA-directed RNA polymerase specialized sigma24 family protein